MNTSDLLEKLLQGQVSGAQQSGGTTGGGLGGLLGGLLSSATNIGAGSVEGGLGSLLGGSLSSRGGTQSRAGDTNYAALASIGMMAFQAYQAWQRSQASATPQQIPQTANLLAGSDAEEHSHAVLCALIAAAKADGQIDAKEQLLIRNEIGKHTDDPQLQRWFDTELAKPLDAYEVAKAANADPAKAAEMYLASLMLVDDQQDAERNYLDSLAAALSIEPQLLVHLEQQAKGLT